MRVATSAGTALKIEDGAGEPLKLPSSWSSVSLTQRLISRLRTHRERPDKVKSFAKHGSVCRVRPRESGTT
jgi:hypothetical protein